MLILAPLMPFGVSIVLQTVIFSIADDVPDFLLLAGSVLTG